MARVLLDKRLVIAGAIACLALGAGSLPAVGAARAPDGPRCFGRVATIVGTDQAEVLRGTTGGDVIVSRGGDDVIRGRGGDDLICTGRGYDSILAGAGNDSVDSGPGDDYLGGGGGDDLLLDPTGKFGSFFEGGPGNDIIKARGSTTFDFVAFPDAPLGMIIDLSEGAATGEGADTLRGIDGVEGTAANDIITGSDGPNFIFAGDGDDSIAALGSPEGDPILDSVLDFVDGGRGIDDIDGGDGFDVVSYAGAASGVTVDLDDQTVSGGESDLIAGIEAANGSGYSDVLIGDNGDNGFAGHEGNDQIDGGSGRDFIAFFDANLDRGRGITVDLAAGTSGGGSEGTDLVTGIEDVFGSEFDDSLKGAEDGNRLFGGFGVDVLEGRAGDDFLDGAAGADELNGGEGSDTCISGKRTSGCESDEAAAPALRPRRGAGEPGATLARALLWASWPAY